MSHWPKVQLASVQEVVVDELRSVVRVAAQQ